MKTGLKEVVAQIRARAVLQASRELQGADIKKLKRLIREARGRKVETLLVKGRINDPPTVSETWEALSDILLCILADSRERALCEEFMWAARQALMPPAQPQEGGEAKPEDQESEVEDS